jgi:integrase
MLVVRPSGSRSWVLRTQARGRRYDLGLGSADDVTLAEAREEARSLRDQLRKGSVPATLKRAGRTDPADIKPTFAEAAKAVHAERAPGWKNPKHAAQWITSVKDVAFPRFGTMPVDAVTSAIILEALGPIWHTKPETARRVKQRIGVVLDWAHARGYRDELAPMRGVDAGLPKQKVRDRHHAAIPYADLPALWQRLCASGGTSALALRLAILTAARSGEVRLAKWDEVDLRERIWTIPANRMKADREHIVPLSDEAVQVLQAAVSLRGPHGLLFPNSRHRALSDVALAKALKTAGGGDFTVHGMRSTFRDWAAEQTDYAGDVVEAALAHTIANKVEAAYRRTNYLEKRRPLMQDWAMHVVGK